MLQQLTKFDGCRVLATDGDIGKIEEAYFDDERWVVRYLVVNTGGWLTGRNVLISPYAVRLVDLAARTVALDITRERVRLSPDVSTHLPVSRQYEAEYFRYFGYPAYWPSATGWAGGATPTITQSATPLTASAQVESTRDRDADHRQDFHLRSSRLVTGYRIRAADDGIGHVEDFLFDDETWAIRFIVIDTRNWLPGRRVLLSPETVRAVDWTQGAITVNQTREQIKGAPEFDPDHLPSGDYEQALRGTAPPR